MDTIRVEDTLVLIPALNEGTNVGRIVSAVRKLGFPVLVIDDGSSDNTSQAARDAGATILRFSENRGKGAAIRHGFGYFLSENYPAIILMDSDGQHDPLELLVFLKNLNEGSMFVVGSRMERATGMPWLRVATNRLMSWLLSFVADQRIPDTQCGYRALRREVVRDFSLSTTRYEIESEMLLQAAQKRYRVDSIPIRCVYEGGKSQIHPWRDTARFVRFLARHIFKKP